MSRNNDVFQVLVTKGNQAALAAGNGLGDLAPGQIGAFDFNTNLSLDASSDPVRNFYLAVGVDTDGDGVTDDVHKSSGSHIQKKNMAFYSFRPATPARPMIVDITNIKASCDSEYAIKIEMRNGEIYQTIGYNQFTKVYSIKTSCCDSCSTECPTGDPNEVVQKLAEAVNADDDKLVTATITAGLGTITGTTEPTADGNLSVTLGDEAAITVAILNADTLAGVATKIANAINGVADSKYTATANTAVVTVNGPAGDITLGVAATGYVATVVDLTNTTVADPTAYLAANPNAQLVLTLTSNGQAINNFGSINMNYFKMRNTNLIVSLVEGFGCSGTVTTRQTLRYEEGLGYDIQQLEYQAGGWNGRPGPYRVSALNGVAQEGFEYFAERTTKYDQIALTYDQFSIGGWLEYLNNLATIIAVPAADTTTRNSILAVLDALLEGQGFDPLADDGAAASSNPAVVEPTEDKTEETDGIA